MDNKGKFALAASLLWTTGVIALVAMKWDKFHGMELNAMGDFLAGAISPLAFLWLIIGYFQQGDELKQNTAALQLQAEELRHAVNEYEKLNETNLRHLKMLEEDNVKREKREADAVRMHLARFAGKFISDEPNPYQGFQCTFKNIGRDVTNVTFNLHLSNAQITPSQIVEMEKDRIFKLKIQTNDSSMREGRLWISYTNGIGKHELMTYNVFMLQDGRVVIADPGDESAVIREILEQFGKY